MVLSMNSEKYYISFKKADLWIVREMSSCMCDELLIVRGKYLVQT